MKQNIADNHSKLKIIIYYLDCLYRDQLQHSHVFEVLVTCGKHACYTKKHGCSRRGRLLAISHSFKFPFVFHYTHMLVLFRTDAIEINWKSTP